MFVIIIPNLFTLKSRLLVPLVVVVFEPSPTDFHAIKFVLKVELQTLYLDNIQLEPGTILAVCDKEVSISLLNVDLVSKISDSQSRVEVERGSKFEYFSCQTSGVADKLVDIYSSSTNLHPTIPRATTPPQNGYNRSWHIHLAYCPKRKPLLDLETADFELRKLLSKK